MQRITTTMSGSETETERVDYLDVDVITSGDLKYALISVVSPDEKLTRQKSNIFAVKIRGAFASKEAAEAHAGRLMKLDPSFDVWVVDMYSWLPLPPPSNTDNMDVIYQEQYLNDLVKGYKENQELAKQQFYERKEKVLKDGLDAHLTPEECIAGPSH
jgi:hypothetical protein